MVDKLVNEVYNDDADDGETYFYEADDEEAPSTVKAETTPTYTVKVLVHESYE